MMSTPDLTRDVLCAEARAFADAESTYPEPSLYGVTDGKAIGTYLEHKFRSYLAGRYAFVQGNSASGIDFPELGVDMKVTSVRQPQSSCPFRSGRQKIYGLGYSVLVFVYDKVDDHSAHTGMLKVLHTVLVDGARTADYQMTIGLREIVSRGGNEDDIVGFLSDRMLPVDDIQARQLAHEILSNPPELGYLTISNALQWRLQYARAIEVAGEVSGVLRL